MTNEHIARAFDRDLEAVQAMIMKMGGLVETALAEAARALETGDEVLADQVRAGDAAIDGLEDAQEIAVTSSFGAPSGPVMTGRLGGVRVTFLARHGTGHHLPPAAVNDRANIGGQQGGVATAQLLHGAFEHGDDAVGAVVLHTQQTQGRAALARAVKGGRNNVQHGLFYQRG